MKNILLGGLIGLLVTVILYAISWIATCGIIWLITLCFGWTFSWGIATGIWLIILLLRTIFKNVVNVKK